MSLLLALVLASSVDVDPDAGNAHLPYLGCDVVGCSVTWMRGSSQVFHRWFSPGRDPRQLSSLGVTSVLEGVGASGGYRFVMFNDGGAEFAAVTNGYDTPLPAATRPLAPQTDYRAQSRFAASPTGGLIAHAYGIAGGFTSLDLLEVDLMGDFLFPSQNVTTLAEIQQPRLAYVAGTFYLMHSERNGGAEFGILLSGWTSSSTPVFERRSVSFQMGSDARAQAIVAGPDGGELIVAWGLGPANRGSTMLELRRLDLDGGTLAVTVIDGGSNASLSTGQGHTVAGISMLQPDGGWALEVSDLDVSAGRLRLLPLWSTQLGAIDEFDLAFQGPSVWIAYTFTDLNGRQVLVTTLSANSVDAGQADAGDDGGRALDDGGRQLEDAGRPADAGVTDGGVADAGSSDAGAADLRRERAVGCGCDSGSAFPAALLALAWWRRRRAA